MPEPCAFAIARRQVAERLRDPLRSAGRKNAAE
jgi:hypothetical protein